MSPRRWINWGCSFGLLSERQTYQGFQGFMGFYMCSSQSRRKVFLWLPANSHKKHGESGGSRKSSDEDFRPQDPKRFRPLQHRKRRGLERSGEYASSLPRPASCLSQRSRGKKAAHPTQAGSEWMRNFRMVTKWLQSAVFAWQNFK